MSAEEATETVRIKLLRSPFPTCKPLQHVTCSLKPLHLDEGNFTGSRTDCKPVQTTFEAVMITRIT